VHAHPVSHGISHVYVVLGGEASEATTEFRLAFHGFIPDASRTSGSSVSKFCIIMVLRAWFVAGLIFGQILDTAQSPHAQSVCECVSVDWGVVLFDVGCYAVARRRYPDANGLAWLSLGLSCDLVLHLGQYVCGGLGLLPFEDMQVGLRRGDVPHPGLGACLLACSRLEHVLSYVLQ
jgi:hypothetical protein